MQEIELKFRVDDFDAVRSKLSKLGASMEWKGDDENIYFDTSEQDLTEQGKVLRLRRWAGHSVVLTYKGPKDKDSEYKIRDELNIEISDWDTALEMLKGLGYQERVGYSKYREHWVLGDVVIELDKLGDGRFVEIEGTKEDIEKFADKLELDRERATTDGYIDILEAMENS